MRRAYEFFLLLYPREHRDRFADEMLQVFEEAAAKRRAQGWGWFVRFGIGEMRGLIGGAAGAWLDRDHPQEAPARTPARGGLSQEIFDAEQRIDQSIAGMVHAIANHQFERARLLSDEERQARARLRILREKYGMNG
jgi:hypothetical protein